MIKIFLQLVAIHGVFCAPGVPFLKYGPPAESNLAEKILPLEKLGSETSETFGILPETPNVFEYSQLPSDLPGTINLNEKSIPDTITLKKIPIPATEIEVPRYAYGEEFLSGEYSNVQSKIEKAGPQETPEQYPPESLPYPNETPNEENGSEIKETQIFPSSNNPQPALQPPAPIPEQYSSGSELQGASLAPGSKPPSNFGATNSVAPASSIKVQDIHGQYAHGFQNLDGTQIEESGHLISTDNGWEYVIAKEGSYRYLSPEGIPISVRYIADEKGFRILGQTFGGW